MASGRRFCSCNARSVKAPGLVADGRDMGTVVFPEADLKIYLTASARARAERRYKQLIEKGFSASICPLSQEQVRLDIEARDLRDAQRAASPLRPAKDAYRIDSSELSVDEVVASGVEVVRAVPGNCFTAAEVGIELNGQSGLPFCFD